MTKISLFTLLSTLIFITGCFQDLVPTQKSVTSTTDDSGDISEVEPSELLPPRSSINESLASPYSDIVTLGGGISWLPGKKYKTHYTIPLKNNIHEAKALFSTDSRLKVRFTVLKRDDQNCYRTNTTGIPDRYPYTELKFKVYLRDIVPSINFSNGDSIFIFDHEQYGLREIGPLGINQQTIVDYSGSPKLNAEATVIEVTDVKSNANCLYTQNQPDSDTKEANLSNYCPVYDIRPQECWKLKVEISTDSFRDF